MSFGESLNGTLREPTIKHSLNGQVYALKSCTKPSISLELMEAVNFNTFEYYPRTIKWKPIKITMVSGLGNKGQKPAAMALYEIFFGSKTTLPGDLVVPSRGYGAMNHDDFETNMLPNTLKSEEKVSISQFADRQELNKFISENIKQSYSVNNIMLDYMIHTMKSMSIFQVNPDGKTIEHWKLDVPMITDVNWGQLTYENDGFVEIEFTVQYWYASLNTSGYFEDPEQIAAAEAERKRKEEEAEEEKRFFNQKRLREEAAEKRKVDALRQKISKADLFTDLAYKNAFGPNLPTDKNTLDKLENAQEAAARKDIQQQIATQRDLPSKGTNEDVLIRGELANQANQRDANVRERKQDSDISADARGIPREDPIYNNAASPQQQIQPQENSSRGRTVTQSYGNISDEERARAEQMEADARGTPRQDPMYNRQADTNQQLIKQQYDEARRQSNNTPVNPLANTNNYSQTRTETAKNKTTINGTTVYLTDAQAKALDDYYSR